MTSSSYEAKAREIAKEIRRLADTILGVHEIVLIAKALRDAHLSGYERGTHSMRERVVDILLSANDADEKVANYIEATRALPLLPDKE